MTSESCSLDRLPLEVLVEVASHLPVKFRITQFAAVSRKTAAAVEEQSKRQAAAWNLSLPRRPRGAAANGAYPWTTLVRTCACAHCGAKGEFQMTCFPGAVRHPSGKAVSNLGYLCLRCIRDDTARAILAKNGIRVAQDGLSGQKIFRDWKLLGKQRPKKRQRRQ